MAVSCRPPTCSPTRTSSSLVAGQYPARIAQRDELIGPEIQPTQMLVRLFHEDQPRVFDPHPVQFGCTCSADRVRQTLSIYSQKDIAHMTTEEGIVTADCQFCGAHYRFDPATLGFEGREVPGDDA